MLTAVVSDDASMRQHACIGISVSALDHLVPAIVTFRPLLVDGVPVDSGGGFHVVMGFGELGFAFRCCALAFLFEGTMLSYRSTLL
jgi:hypothetical protein